jgi:class 3 adenylate cyclase/tetratricopeptide (TPR) repeat protein
VKISRLIVFAVLLSALSPCLAQEQEEIERTTEEVETLLRRAATSTSDAEIEQLAGRSLSMARSVRYEGGITRACILLAELFARQGRASEALQFYLEAEAKLEAKGNRETLTAVRLALGDIFFREKMYGSARRYYDQVLKSTPDDFTTLEKAADASLYNLQFDSADSIYQKLTITCRESYNLPCQTRIYQKLAAAYDQDGNPGKSLYYYLRIKDIIEQSGTTIEQSLLYNNLGRQYAILRDYEAALEYLRKAELQCKFIDCDYNEILFANIGIALHNTGQTREGIEYLLKARDILLARKDFAALANLEHLMATVYFSNGDLYNALSHNDLAVRYAQDTKQQRVLAEAYRTAADLYHELYEFEKAFDNYKSYLNVLDAVRTEERAREMELSQQRALLAEAEGQIKFLIARQNFKDLELSQLQFESEKLSLLNKNLELETREKENQLQLLAAQKDADQAKLRQQSLEVLRSRQESKLAAQQLAAEKQTRLIAELRQKETIERAQNMADSTRRAQELYRVQRDQEYQIQRDANFRSFVTWMGALGAIIVALLIGGWWLSRQTGQRLKNQNRQIQEQNREIEQERHKSEGLLLNILPEEIARELKAGGQARPKLYQSVTVLFTDFINFTKLSAQLTPGQIIDELNECFLAFDEICERHSLEKIKTIGDAYMCAGGLPVVNDTHPSDAVRAAFEMISWLETRNRNNPNALLREMRIGIHTGPVVAGVIGKNKFAYDIWGDAVNLAARLEEHGEHGKVNVSGATAEAVRHLYHVEPRGSFSVHNKGEVEMFFVRNKGK